MKKLSHVLYGILLTKMPNKDYSLFLSTENIELTFNPKRTGYKVRKLTPKNILKYLKTKRMDTYKNGFIAYIEETVPTIRIEKSPTYIDSTTAKPHTVYKKRNHPPVELNFINKDMEDTDAIDEGIIPYISRTDDCIIEREDENS